MVVKNTHTPAAAAMQACVTHSTCVADFVLYTSAPDRGGRKICRWPWCMCAQAKHFPHALFIDQPLSPWMSWPRWKQSSLNKDSYSWFCFCGWLHLSFWSPLYQQAFISALILQPQFVDRCRIKWFLLSVTDMFLSLWVVDGSDAASDEVAVCESSWCLTCCSVWY